MKLLLYLLEAKFWITFAFSHQNDKYNKIFGDNSNFLCDNKFLDHNDDIFDYNSIKMTNYTETSYIARNNNHDFPKFYTISQYNKVTYIANVVYKIRFLLFIYVFIA